MIELPGLGTVGYLWSFDVAEDREGTVDVRELDPRVGPVRPPGESASHVFALSARRPGRALVHFEQRRPWEQEAAPHEVRDYEVVVEG